MVMNPVPARTPPAATTAFTARVVRSDTTGVWVTPLGDDQRHPIGPCRGAHAPDGAGGWQQLPAGVLVLLVLTADGPWVAAHHQEV